MGRVMLRANPYLEDGITLYHGTTPDNFERIRHEGLRPRQEGRGTSRHHTASRDHVFLTNKLEGGLLYADEDDPVILEIDARGLDLRPDLDDVTYVLRADLDQLEEVLSEEGIDWKPEVGKAIPESIERDVEWSLETLNEWADHRLPTTLAVWDGDLVAVPWVAIRVPQIRDLELLDEYPDDLLTLPASNFVHEQYMVKGAVPVENIRAVWVHADRAEGERKQMVTYFADLQDVGNSWEGIPIQEFGQVPMARLEVG